VSAAIFRSYLFAPGHHEKLLGKVFTSGADAVVLDLEDAVPADQKQSARDLVAAALKSRAVKGEASPAIYVRLNAVSTDLWRDDLAAAVGPAVRGIRLAKAEAADEVKAAGEALAAAEERAGIAVGSLVIVPTIESAAGVLAAAEIARQPRVEALAFGQADFVRDVGAETDELETQTLYARSQLVVVSRAAGIRPPIASVYTRIKDLDGLRASSEAARRLGFFGRSAIHPSQLPVINEVFTPTPAQIAAARAIIEAYTAAAATGVTAFAMGDGQFVDAPIVERARAIVRLADALSRPQNEKMVTDIMQSKSH
jgi:citrate lyase subunit beta/citryl-CoA lyase